MKRVLPIQSTRSHPTALLRWLLHALAWGLAGLLLIVLMYQVPARHSVHVGYNDAAYAQGFNDPVNRWGVLDPESHATAPLRWSRAQSYLIFPQIGLPATATVRWRALRPQGAPLPTVRVLLNGRQELGVFQATGEWETHSFTIDGGLLKANDIFLELRVEPPVEADDETRGVQVDRAALATSAWPIRPYPSQLAYGAAAIVLGTALVRRRLRQLAVALTIALVFLLLYRLQLTPYPLRTLPPLLLVALGALLAVRALPQIGAAAQSRLLLALGVALPLLWFGWLLLTARGHVALSVPGVERDFPVFATRATALLCGAGQTACVLRADGFYQLGYPFLLWLVKPLTSASAFLAARPIAALSGLLLLLTTWLLGLIVAPVESRRGGALLAVLALALSPFVVRYALYVGTDMPFAALWTSALAALLVPRVATWRSALLAGLLCGLAFLIRHPGLVLLPVGWIALMVLAPDAPESPRRWLQRVPWRLCGWLTLGWLLGAAPQLVVNLADTGTPLYSQQAKNIWLAVYGNIDFGGRWQEAADDVTLREIVLADPPRFFGNWLRNLQAFVGTGAEDTSEFGQAIGLRLLAFPANWLALLGLALWLWRGDRRHRLLVVGALVYVLGVCIGFVLPRFFLPLAPIWALASAAPLVYAARVLAQSRWTRRLNLSRAQWLLALGIVLVAVLARGPQIGARYVLEHQDRALVPQALLPAPSDSSIARYVVWPSHQKRPALSSLVVVEPYHILIDQ
ncbi:MAG TPA: hypothetical protein VFZ66_07730 [Herpetosiphonaceae bacterium]